MLLSKIQVVLVLGLLVTFRPSLSEAAQVLDVALAKGGTLNVRLLDSDGQPVANQVITVGKGKRATQAFTDKDGSFSVSGLQGGSYQFTGADGSEQSYRLWAPNTQPPSAQSGTLSVFAEAKGKGGNGNGNSNGNGSGNEKPDKLPRECRLSPSHPKYNPDAECPPATP